MQDVALLWFALIPTRGGYQCPSCWHSQSFLGPYMESGLGAGIVLALSPPPSHLGNHWLSSSMICPSCMDGFSKMVEKGLRSFRVTSLFGNVCTCTGTTACPRPASDVRCRLIMVSIKGRAVSCCHCVCKEPGDVVSTILLSDR